MRIDAYCSQEQLLALYKTLLWSALDHDGRVCYSHASEPLLQKVESLQHSTLRILGEPLNGRSLSTRRKTAHAAMVYKQTVLHNTSELCHDASPDPRSHIHRTSTTCHPYQQDIRRNPKDLKFYEQLCPHSIFELPFYFCFPSTFAS